MVIKKIILLSLTELPLVLQGQRGRKERAPSAEGYARVVLCLGFVLSPASCVSFGHFDGTIFHSVSVVHGTS